MQRKANIITKKEDLDFLLNIKEDDVTLSFLMDNFGEFNGKRRFNTYDVIEIPKGTYGPEGGKNKNNFITTVGLFVFNKFFIEKELFDQFKYINKTLNKKALDNINTTLSYALLEDDISLEVLKNYLKKTQWIMAYVSIFSPSYSTALLLCTKDIEKKKKELFKKYDAEIKSGNILIVGDIEKELMAYAKELLKDDPALDAYDSGVSSFANFKDMYVMKGLTADPDPNKGYDILTSAYATGIKKDEYANYAKTLSTGAYSRARKTEVGGYDEKLFLSAYQHIVLDKAGSDCGTKRYLTVDFSEENIHDYMYSYIVEGSSLVEITSKNMDKYNNKIVKLKFSSLCESKKNICSKCAGNMYYRLGIKNAGVTAPIIPSKLKNLSMKKFHVSNQSFTEMDPMKAFSLI